MNNDNSILDSETDWINNFEKTDKLYKDFYTDDVYYTNIHYIYINKNNDIEKIKEESFLMSKPNYITRDELLKILKCNSFENNKRYSILSILKINVLIKPEEIKNFLTEKNFEKYGDDFITQIRNFDTIVFEKTINMFHDLNDLILIFYEKINKNNNFINRNNLNDIKESNNLNNLNNSNSFTSSSNNITKKINLNINHKKTIRKQYKDYLT